MEDCFDENNEDDGLSFDERLSKKLNEEDNKDLKEIFDANNGFKDFV